MLGATITVGVLVAFLMLINIIYIEKYSTVAEHNYIRKIYQEIQAVTGQTQDSIPLVISDQNIINAYNDGHYVVIYQGLIDKTETWDEIAMVLGHETAHGMLGHLNRHLIIVEGRDHKGMGGNDFISMLEANADKMGAFYMMRAGYNACKGREFLKRWQTDLGDAIGENHPDFSYRYHNLNINCGKD